MVLNKIKLLSLETVDSDSFLGMLPGQQLLGNCYKWKVSGPTADLLFQEL